MAEMEYGQQALAAQQAAEFARAAEARMAAEKGKAPAPAEEEFFEDEEVVAQDDPEMVELLGDLGDEDEAPLSPSEG